MPNSKNNNNISKNDSSNLSINQQLEKLDQQIEWFYGENFSLDEAARHYQEAASSAKTIEESLDKIKNQIEIIDHDFSKE